MRVTTRSSRPRARTVTSMCGAWPSPSAPGFTVTIWYRPSSSVRQRPKPRKPDPEAPRGSSGWSKRPSASACQVSITPSGTDAPAPSRTTPEMRIAPGVPSGTTRCPSVQVSPMDRNGPTVCDGVSRSLMGLLERGLLAAAQHDVPAVGERPLRPGGLQVERRDHALASLRVRDRVEDRVLVEQGVVREVHLRDEPLGESVAEQREVDVGRAPRVVVVAPRVGARLDRGERVLALVVGEH